jgi:hypothetical protein
MPLSNFRGSGRCRGQGPVCSGRSRWQSAGMLAVTGIKQTFDPMAVDSPSGSYSMTN